ncbi:MAG: hypothetical protein BWY22_02098 [Bacteroidetes bacterium ADurb.Bin217]|nr:MAG: hypothetical protein BWY22_02098 [Bacteroidetes bacterium ADurb.Bin217]
MSNKLFFGLLIIGMTSCSKYDEGGTILNAQKKLTNTSWIEVYSPISDSTGESLDTIVYTFKKDGNVLVQMYVGDSTNSKNVTWQLNDTKERITIGSEEYVIEKLTNNDFWFSVTFTNVILPGDIQNDGSIATNDKTITLVRKCSAWKK